MLTHEKTILNQHNTDACNTPVSSSSSRASTSSPAINIDASSPNTNLNADIAEAPAASEKSTKRNSNIDSLDEATIMEFIREPHEVVIAKAKELEASTKRQDTLLAHQIQMDRERMTLDRDCLEFEKRKFESEERERAEKQKREAERDAELNELRAMKRLNKIKKRLPH